MYKLLRDTFFCSEYGHPSAPRYQFYSVKLSSCLYVQISMNVTQTMEAVNRHVSTQQDLECVAAGLGLS